MGSTAKHRPDASSLERPVSELLAAARPLPDGDDMIIDDLTVEEEAAFFEAIRNA